MRNSQIIANQQQQQMHFYCILQTIVIGALVSMCEQVTYSTSSTKCTIGFQSVNAKQLLSSASSNRVGAEIHPHKQQLDFKSCVRKICQTYTADGNCKSSQLYVIEQAPRCYQECCGSKVFDMDSCEDYNKVRVLRQLKINRSFVIGTYHSKSVLSMSLLGLITAVLIFIFKSKNADEMGQKETLQKVRSHTSSETYSQWQQCEFKPEEKQCCVCKQLDASVVLPCRSYYHLECLRELENWNCIHCKRSIAKIRVFCHICLRYYMTLKAGSILELENKLAENYSLHPQHCYNSILLEEYENNRREKSPEL